MFDAPFTVPTVLLALVLLLSGAAKLRDLQTAEDAFVSLRLLRWLMRLKAPQILPFGELALAVALLVCSGWLAVVVSVCALALFAAYLVIIVRALTFNEPVTCSCFGKLGLGAVDRFTAVRNVILVALAALGVVDALRGRSVISRLADFSGAEWMWMGGVFAAIALTWLITGDRSTPASSTQPTASTSMAGASGASGSAVSSPAESQRQAIPNLTVMTPAGESLQLRDVVKTPQTVIAFVSPTCGPCVRLIEDLRTWQKDNDTAELSVVLTLLGEPNASFNGLVDPQDFMVYFDPRSESFNALGGGTPSMRVLTADGFIRGTAVVGDENCMSLINGLVSGKADEELFSGNPTLVTPPPTPAAPAEDPEDPQAYLRRPSPFALVKNANDDEISLLQLAGPMIGPAVVIIVSPSCGSCIEVLQKAHEWKNGLGPIQLYWVVSSSQERELVQERFRIAPENVLVDASNALTRMMHVGTPSLIALGPDDMLLAGPVSGGYDITETMNEIIAEIHGANPDLAEADVAGETVEGEVIHDGSTRMQ